MKRYALLLALPLALALTGCPMSSTQQQQVLKASDDAALIVATAQQAETAAAKQGLISPADDQFIEIQFQSIANMGKTVDSCVAGANDKNATVACITTAINEVDVINSNGGLYLKSTQAKNDFAIAVAGVRTTLASIETMLGGTAPPVPATVGGGQ
jgi:Flp pilus assembly protein TadG